jgi:hypothetical protein
MSLGYGGVSCNNFDYSNVFNATKIQMGLFSHHALDGGHDRNSLRALGNLAQRSIGKDPL